SWLPDRNSGASEIARTFLRSEYELLCLARVQSSSVTDLEQFLRNTAGAPLAVERSTSDELLISAPAVGETLLITGKTAEVLCAYIDSEPVRTEDRADMTLRRSMFCWPARIVSLVRSGGCGESVAPTGAASRRLCPCMTSCSPPCSPPL